MLPGGFLRVWPSHRHFRCPSSSDIAFCPVLSHNSSFRILSGHLILRIFLRHVLTKAWSLFRRVLVSFQVSHPYKSTDFTFELKSLHLVLVEIVLSFQTFPREINANLAFDILAFMSASVPPTSSTTLPKYVKVLTSSNAWFFTMIGSLFAE